MGSLGSPIAFQVAERLGYRIAWRDVINQAARRASAPEAALAAIDELGLLGMCPTPQSCRAYRREVEKIVLELADTGNFVILGRAGQVILRKRPDVLHVRISAPPQVRAERIAVRTGVELECAQAQVEASDRFHRSYMRRHYHVAWDDPALYHLCLNTQALSQEQAVDIICHAVEALHIKS
jgi:cytidylate kinase